jgi:restriction endonuclease S subunit
MPYLRVANVQDGHLDLAEVKRVTVPRWMTTQCRVHAGDVLMTEGGDPDKLGRGAVWPGDIDPCLHQNHVFAVRPDRSRLLPEYLAVLTRTPYARAYFEMTASKTTGLASTSASKIAAFRVPLAPVAKQKALVLRVTASVEKVDTLRNQLARQIALLQEHHQALITAAVTGQLDTPEVAA